MLRKALGNTASRACEVTAEDRWEATSYIPSRISRRINRPGSEEEGRRRFQEGPALAC